jgi:hypothetical protein
MGSNSSRFDFIRRVLCRWFEKRHMAYEGSGRPAELVAQVLVLGSVGLEMGEAMKQKQTLPIPAICPACQDKRLHTVREWTEFHRFAGHGYVENVGWTHPELAEAAGERSGGDRAAGSAVSPLQG